MARRKSFSEQLSKNMDNYPKSKKAGKGSKLAAAGMLSLLTSTSSNANYERDYSDNEKTLGKTSAIVLMLLFPLLWMIDCFGIGLICFILGVLSYIAQSDALNSSSYDKIANSPVNTFSTNISTKEKLVPETPIINLTKETGFYISMDEEHLKNNPHCSSNKPYVYEVDETIKQKFEFILNITGIDKCELGVAGGRLDSIYISGKCIDKDYYNYWSVMFDSKSYLIDGVTTFDEFSKTTTWKFKDSGKYTSFALSQLINFRDRYFINIHGLINDMECYDNHS